MILNSKCIIEYKNYDYFIYKFNIKERYETYNIMKYVILVINKENEKK